MKKILFIITVLAVCFSVASCGNDDKSKSLDETASTVTTKAESPSIDKSIDGIAAHLGLKGGEDNLYERIGAKAGKEYNKGEVEIYEFDIDSDAYKKIEKDGKVSTLTVDAHKEGFALVFPSKKDDAMIKLFNEVKF